MLIYQEGALSSKERDVGTNVEEREKLGEHEKVSMDNNEAVSSFLVPTSIPMTKSCVLVKARPTRQALRSSTRQEPP